MKYPRFTREENRSCKLTEQDIKDIKEMARRGKEWDILAQQFNVCKKTIQYWVDDAFRARIKMSQRGRTRPANANEFREDWAELRERKGARLAQYLVQKQKEYRKKYPLEVKQAQKGWREENPEYSKQKTKAWRQKNPQKAKRGNIRYYKAQIQKIKKCIDCSALINKFSTRCYKCSNKYHKQAKKP